MANSKILAKITMLSAGSAAPYDSAVVGLTTWDQDLVVGGVTYLKGRIIALSKAAASSGDASRGQGGYASPLELSLTIADRCAAGRLWPLVEAGAVPLVGAEVRIINESGDVAPQTWYLHEPKLDGASIKFTLKTMRYLCTKPVSWSAVLGDKTATIGLAVGDAAIQDINASGRYKGVSVPTASQNVTKKIDGKTLSEWNYGNPAEPDYRQQIRIISASEMATTTVASDTTQDEDGPRDFWKTARPAFVFNFETQQQLDAFWDSYIGLDLNNGGWQKLQPNTSLIISDGSNSETLIRRDANGFPILGAHRAPIVGIDADSLASRSVAVRQTANHMQLGTVQAYKGNPNIYQEWIVINEPLLFAKNYALRSFGGGNYPSFFVAPILGGSLASSDPESVALYISNTFLPICVGATGIVGFNNESAIVVAPGNAAISGQVLQFNPTLVDVDGFEAWTDVDISKKIALTAYVLGGTDFSALFHGKIINAVGDDSSYFSQKMICGASSGGSGAARYIQYAWRAKITKTDLGFTPSYLFVDFSAVLDMVKNSDYTKVKPMIPFVANNSDYELESTGSYQIYSMGRGANLPSRKFDSIDALNKSPACQFVIKANSSDDERSAIEMFQNVHIYAISKISLGQNPAVVVPGDFPGTSNPTTTPAMAIDQLAAWAGLSVIQTGGWTPPAGVWGRYLGPDPSSSDSTDPLTVTQAIDKLSSEAWMWVAEGSAPAAAPTIESMTPPVLDTSSIDDVVTLPRISYCYAGTSAQFTAEIFKADESFDIAKGDGYFWGGWQEKDACHFSTSPGSSVLAMCQLEDCLAVVCADGYLRCSYDGGVTWPFSLNLGDTSDGMVMAGNGIMLAFSYLSGNVVVARSIDAGRTWSTSSPAALAGATIPGSWYDADSQRFWLCGSLSGGGASLWYSSDGITWTHISAELSIGSRANRIAASGNLLVVSAAPDTWGIWISTNLGATWTRTPALPQTGIAEPFLGRWNGAFRVAVGTALYSSADLLTWTNSVTPTALISFATDGKVVSALGSEASEGNHVYYSRDQGVTWKAVRVSPEGATWAHTDATVSVWDDNAKCFRFAAWGPTRIIALGDPSVLDIWLRCRASYLKTQTLHAETYDWAGVYDADVIVSMLLDAKDGIDTEYEQARIDWMAKQARFATLKVEFADIVEQLSLTAFQRISIPRQRLEDSLLAGNVPTYGLLTKVEPDPMTGISTIEIIMPPL